MFADFSPRPLSPPAPPPGPARTTFVTAVALAAPRAAVFRLLADIEALPRWAAPFCERVDLTAGRWVALTMLGELDCTLAADEAAGAVVLRFSPGAGRPDWVVPLRVVAPTAGGTVVTLTLTHAGGPTDGRFARLNGAWLAVMRGLVVRFGRNAGPIWEPRADLGVRAPGGTRCFNLGDDRRRAA